ncbi:hypothetical protein BN938_1000 [Mucinivorans hirudinis]|uniref:Uncharacterized protein n=1 Tax=Mucinivorans hirudinis TaxID=1433126 RepID=A0A060RBC6_9BACT|nr:hypothetical protein BN938_1000 [Mucinivorans hirudinis]
MKTYLQYTLHRVIVPMMVIVPLIFLISTDELSGKFTIFMIPYWIVYFVAFNRLRKRVGWVRARINNSYVTTDDDAVTYFLSKILFISVGAAGAIYLAVLLMFFEPVFDFSFLLTLFCIFYPLLLVFSYFSYRSYKQYTKSHKSE